MLSRVAENLFWLARYLERAENTARLLDVNYYATLEGVGLVGELWVPLVEITGSKWDFDRRGYAPDGESVVRWLAFAGENPSSIRSCLARARENGRSLRDRLSSEMWECLNRSYHALCFGTEFVLPNDELHHYCKAAREASHLLFGIAEATLPRDLGWHFLGAGRLLERGDNVLRLLGVRLGEGDGEVGEALENHRWMAVLKTASAYEAYRKAHQARLDRRLIAEFLLLSPTFPRSVRLCAEGLREHLEWVASESPSAPSPALLGAAGLAARLERVSIGKVLDVGEPSLPSLLADVHAVGAAVHETYFRPERHTA